MVLIQEVVDKSWTTGLVEWETIPIKVSLAQGAPLANPVLMLSIRNKPALLKLIAIGQIASSDLSRNKFFCHFSCNCKFICSHFMFFHVFQFPWESLAWAKILFNLKDKTKLPEMTDLHIHQEFNCDVLIACFRHLNEPPEYQLYLRYSASGHCC